MPARACFAACLVAAAALAAAGPAEADTVIGVAGPMSGSFAAFGERDARPAPPRPSPTSTPPAASTAGPRPAGDGRQVRRQDRRRRRQPARRQGRRHGRRPSLPQRLARRRLGLCCQPASSRSRPPRPGRTTPTSARARHLSGSPAATTSRASLPARPSPSRFPDKAVAVIDDRSPYGKAACRRHAARHERGRQARSLHRGIRPRPARFHRPRRAPAGGQYRRRSTSAAIPTEAGLIASQIRDAGLDTVIVGPDTLVTNEYRDVAGDAAEGTLVTFAPDAAREPRAAGGGGGLPRPRHRAGRLRPAELRRRPGLGRGGHAPPAATTSMPSSRRSTAAVSPPSSATSASTPRATCRCRASSSTCGAAAASPQPASDARARSRHPCAISSPMSPASASATPTMHG